MTDWIESNYQTALDFLNENEEEAQVTLHFSCTPDVSVVLPIGLPALGVRFHGAFMLAPLPIFMLSVASLPIIGFSTSWQIGITSLGITLGCGILFLGLLKCLKLLLGQRELFPRNHFATIGPEGIAMHYSRIQLPGNQPKAFLRWNEIKSLSHTTVIFPPALLIGKFRVPALQLTGTNGNKIVLPYRNLSANETAVKELESALRSRIS